MNTEKTKDLVHRGQQAFEAAETKLVKVSSALEIASNVIEEGHKENIAGSMKTKKLQAKLLNARGKLGKAMELIISTHEECTRLCEAKGVDVPFETQGGGDR